MSFRACIIELIHTDALRMQALSAVRSLELPGWLIAAGFVRNRVWDHVFKVTTPLSDIDVIYFCSSDTSEERDLMLERQLSAICPDLPWSVKNQARMHIRNGDLPYGNSLDAMSYWPEKQTALGVSLNAQNMLSIQHCFSLDLQFSGKVNHNPVRDYNVFLQRLTQKNWLSIWPGLEVAV
ncbi:nucleotidyltransferase family protein [Aliamphritea ceti]|uniref:nucleotidyltransferase family protein n=1 Tax=Aliamphritea ceti TaxID=1524258 RepID=UPI0021C2F8A7|nr:nucleotidyltransferase family protein [Aliamphritea ceti]